MEGTLGTMGRMVGRALAIAGLLVLFMGIAHGEVSAETKVKGKVHPSITAEEYVHICADAGAQTIRVITSKEGQTVVTCEWSDGFTSKCNFSTKECVDTIPRRIGQGGQEYAEVSSLRAGIQPDTNGGAVGTEVRGRPQVRAAAAGIGSEPSMEEAE